MNIDDIKRLDCKEIIARELGQPMKNRGNQWAWACPFHHGQKPNFTADSEGWRCWSDCGESGDVISFIQKLHGLDFLGACRYLGATETTYERKPVQIRPHWKQPEPPAQTWQELIEDLNQKAVNCLWSERGKIARDYLHGRGLSDETIERANLGYIPEGKKWYNLQGVKVPSGITIPSTIDGQLWQVRVRRVVGASQGDKYRSIGDGKLEGSLFWGDYLEPHKPVVIVESEMDCLTLLQLAGNFCPVALSSASNTLSQHWLTKLIFAPKIMLRTDDDKAGLQCRERHLALSDGIKPISVPTGYKDINELYQADPALCQHWLDGLLEVLPEQPAEPPKMALPRYRFYMRNLELNTLEESYFIGFADARPYGWQDNYQLPEQRFYELLNQGLPLKEVRVIYA